MAGSKIKTATLGGTVWNDVNHDGLQNDGNIGIAGVKVLLLNGDGKATGKFAISDANGNYTFAGLKPGEYSVKFDTSTLPNGAAFTQKDVGRNNNIDSDANVTTGKTGEVELKAGDVNTSLDAGVVLPQVVLGTVSGHVWKDDNSNGTQDSGEAGYAGVEVVLSDSPFGAQYIYTTTDSGGNYVFDGVIPGAYAIQFNPSDIKYTTPTAPHQGTDPNKDSDIDPIFAGNLDVIVNAGDTSKIDAGFLKAPPINIGATRGVWLDANGDGWKGDAASEPGIEGVTVTLIDRGADGVFGGTDDTVIATTMTNSTGDYNFLVEVSAYSLVFSKPGSTIIFTRMDNQSPRGDIASDSDANGLGEVHVVDNTHPDFISAGVISIVGTPAAALTDALIA